jgi:hypothetical protein
MLTECHQPSSVIFSFMYYYLFIRLDDLGSTRRASLSYPSHVHPMAFYAFVFLSTYGVVRFRIGNSRSDCNQKQCHREGYKHFVWLVS